MSLDLFTPLVPEERFHPAFAKLVGQARECDKKVLNEWAEGFVDRDRKLVKEFQLSFDSSFWEIYLHAALKELSCVCDFRWSRPDFCVSGPVPFLMEATVALNAKGTPAVTETNPLEMPKDFNEFNRQAIIRLSNSIDAKHKKYVGSYAQLPHVLGKPFVVALAPFDRPHFQLQSQRAIEALLYRYYLDEEAFLRRDPARTGRPLPEALPSVALDSGKELPLGLFCDESMAGISAVVQSTAATWSKVRVMSRDPDVKVQAIYENRAEGGQYAFDGPNERYSEGLLDGLRVYHNPHARHPLNPAVFDRPEVFQATCRGPVNVTLLSEARRNLVNRTVMTFPVGFMKKALEGVPPDKSFWYFIR